MSDSSPSFNQTLALLRPGPLRRYFLGESVSVIGTWMQTMALAWVMTTLTDRAFLLGLVNFAGGLPMLMLTMVGGTVADRFDKRRILLFTQAAQIVLALTMGYLVLTHKVSMWHVVVISALLGLSNAFDMPAVSALLPELVERHEISGAIALDRSIFHAARLIGPALGGVVVGIWGAAAAFFINALSFVPLMIALTTLAARQKGTVEEEEQRNGGMSEGLKFVRSDRPTMAMIGLTAMTTMFVFPVMTVMLPLYVRLQLRSGADGMGMLMAVAGMGSLAGSIGLLSISRSRRWAAMSAASAGIAVGLVGLVLAHSIYVAAPFLLINALSLSSLVGLANTTIQERAPATLRGRVSAVAGLSFFGLMPIASLALTALADGLGMPMALAIGTALFTVGAAFMLLGPARAIAQPLLENRAQAIP